MRKIYGTGLAAAALVGFGISHASANVVTGTEYAVTQAEAGDATPATVAGLPAGDLAATFSEPSTPLSNHSGSAYTVGEFLASGGATGITYDNGHAGTDTLDGTLFDFKGTVTVTNGETFTVGHDDGLTLVIGGTTVISEPGPTSFVVTTDTYTGVAGNLSFELVYGECCGAPADLSISLPLVSPVPEPAALGILGVGLIGLGAIRRRRG